MLQVAGSVARSSGLAANSRSRPHPRAGLKTPACLTRFSSSRNMRIQVSVGEAVDEDVGSVVAIDYETLRDPETDLISEIEKAYGPKGLGILCVVNVPEFNEKRKKLLPLAEALAKLPADELEELESPESQFSYGWSHGKEILEGGQPDLYKGSFYANPFEDNPTDNQKNNYRDAMYAGGNIWPHDQLPDLEEAFKDLSDTIFQVGKMLAIHCDNYVRSKIKTDDTFTSQFEIIKRSTVHKGRLLHYFPVRDNSDCNNPSWCGWHLDHCSLTGLAGAMYMNDGNEVTNPDPQSGLYVRTRTGEVLKAAIPKNTIAYQMGEAMQVHTGGLLRATPHYVRTAQGPNVANMSRNTFALFMQPSWNDKMDCPQSCLAGQSLADVGVDHWEPGIDFAEFTKRRLNEYYRK